MTLRATGKQLQPSSAGLTVTNLSCVRGDRLLFSEVGFELCPGDLIQIGGPNGSGKTTLLRVVSGLAWPEEGEVLWKGEIQRNSESFPREFIYVGHQDGLKFELSTLENLKFYARVFGSSIAQVTEALTRMRLDTVEDVPAARLSAGQRRRAALTRLLLTERELWILDEPFTSLDTDGRRIVESLIEEQLDRGGRVLMTSHQDFLSIKLASRRQELSLGH